MRKPLTALASLALAAGLLSGCGGGSGSSSAYCDDLKADKAQFSSMTGADAGKLGDAFAALHKLAKEAPDAVADEWNTIDDAITAIEDAMNKAGLSADDLAGLQSGQLPKNVDMSALQELGPKLQTFGTQMAQASEAIAKDAKDNCGITISTS